ncbi:MAG: TIGR02391 family protein [Nitrospirota bacterium]
MSIIQDVFPPIDIALALESEELAVPLLECLCRFEERGNNKGMLNRYNFINSDDFQGYCEPHYYETIAKAVTEAWMWLENEGFIAPNPLNTSVNWIFVTKRGMKFRNMGDVEKFKIANLLPQKILDPQLAGKVRSPFLRGDYESAIFEAFKEVEIRVRQLAGLGAENLGVKLMRKAFKPGEGILSDKEQTTAEQQGFCDLFAGALASFKNPSSHRDINFTEPEEAVELIMFADLLIRIAERRRYTKNV